MIGREKEGWFSYSGLKTAMWRLTENQKPLTKEKIQNLAAAFQNTAFTHLTRIMSYQIENFELKIGHLLVGGGVANNVEVRRKLRKTLKPFGIKTVFPYTKRLCGDNAAMVGITAYLKENDKNLNAKSENFKSIDRQPRMKIN